MSNCHIFYLIHRSVGIPAHEQLATIEISLRSSWARMHHATIFLWK